MRPARLCLAMLVLLAVPVLAQSTPACGAKASLSLKALGLETTPQYLAPDVAGRGPVALKTALEEERMIELLALRPDLIRQLQQRAEKGASVRIEVHQAGRQVESLSLPDFKQRSADLKSRAVPLVGALGFLLGIPSALSMQVFDNQDFVWGVGLMLSGFFFAFAVVRYGASRFRRDFINTADSDLRVRRWRDWLAALVNRQSLDVRVSRVTG